MQVYEQVTQSRSRISTKLSAANKVSQAIVQTQISKGMLQPLRQSPMQRFVANSWDRSEMHRHHVLLCSGRLLSFRHYELTQANTSPQNLL